MKIAIIGSGVSGLTVAHMLNKQHDISVFESSDYVGGHVNTIHIEDAQRNLEIDTGFIVFNDWTYPNFEKLIKNLDIKIQNSQMSFSAKCEATGFEWSGNGLKGLMFNRDNWNQLKSYQMFSDIIRFNKDAKLFIQEKNIDISLGQFLKNRKYSDAFIKYYILPMGAAIWSSEAPQINEFPAYSFLQFFNNHGLLNLKKRPQWKTIVGGSKQYVQQLIKPFEHKIFLNSPVQKIKRVAQRIEIFSLGRNPEYFDHVFFACHADQALGILVDPTEEERTVLSAIRFQVNTAILHTDNSIMPQRKDAWSAWNYLLPKENAKKSVAVTYYMNLLQNISAGQDYFVSLNIPERIKPESIIANVEYMHPVFDKAAIRAQKKHSSINGHQHTWYCGAYWRNGFHEDGVWSAIQSVEQFNKYIKNEELHLQRAS